MLTRWKNLIFRSSTIPWNCENGGFRYKELKWPLNITKHGSRLTYHSYLKISPYSNSLHAHGPIFNAAHFCYPNFRSPERTPTPIGSPNRGSTVHLFIHRVIHLHISAMVIYTDVFRIGVSDIGGRVRQRVSRVFSHAPNRPCNNTSPDGTHRIVTSPAHSSRSLALYFCVLL